MTIKQNPKNKIRTAILLFASFGESFTSEETTVGCSTGVTLVEGVSGTTFSKLFSSTLVFSFFFLSTVCSFGTSFLAVCFVEAVFLEVDLLSFFATFLLVVAFFGFS